MASGMPHAALPLTLSVKLGYSIVASEKCACSNLHQRWNNVAQCNYFDNAVRHSIIQLLNSNAVSLRARLAYKVRHEALSYSSLIYQQHC
jgi:abortive infection bacteriophage resistance protein